MTPILDLLGAAFVGLAVVWPLSFFGYRFYHDTVEAELKRREQEGGH